MINKIKNKKRGFTLIEMLVAVLLLTTAITGPITIASKGLTASIVAKDQIAAFFLAQDAVEYVRFIRESNRLAGLSWLTALDSQDGTSNGHTAVFLANGGTCFSTASSRSCYVDSIRDRIEGCSLNNCNTAVRYDSANSYFTSGTSGPGSFTLQNFKRTVRIVTPAGSNANEALLIVTVTWVDQANITRSVEVRESLFNWQ